MNWSGQRQDLRLCESGVKPKLRTNRCITGCLGSLRGSQWAGCQLTPVHHWHQASPWLWSQARQVHHPSRPSPHVAKLAFACSLARVHFEPLGPAYTAGLPHHTILPVRDPALEHHPEDHFPLVFSQKAELRDQLQPKNCLETCDLNRSGEPERKLTGRYALDCSPLWTGAQSSWDTRTSGISESSEQEKVSAPAHTSVVNRDPTGVNASHWRVCTWVQLWSKKSLPRPTLWSFSLCFLRNCIDSGLILKSLIHVWVDFCVWY